MNARNARMIRESNTSAGAFTAAVASTLVVLLVSAAMPSGNSPVQVASSMPSPDARATEGNVVDLTY